MHKYLKARSQWTPDWEPLESLEIKDYMEQKESYPPVSEGVFYKFLKISKSFEESRQYCTRAFDGLAEVHNSQEQRALSLVVEDTAWIGVLKCGGDWCYPSSLSRVTYTNWADGEPNNYKVLFFGGEENCVEMLGSHEWNDENCDDKNYFVCQKFHCQETTCNRRGTCSELIDGFKCSCNQGYYGDTCENGECKSTTCNGRGTCSELPSGLRCKCEQGFYGNNCENGECKSTTCNGRGTCSELPSGLRCTCEQGFYGNNCENAFFINDWAELLGDGVRSLS
ncbi:protein jagged-1-like [Mobula hypostoma]|uniref:protein jagged-1-like n=1 Tax=Mobula hypostoma TaxID=723540 RepID=UPI002FC32B37